MRCDLGINAHWIERQLQCFQFFIAAGMARVLDGVDESVQSRAVPAIILRLGLPVFHLQPLNVGDGDRGADFALRFDQHGHHGFALVGESYGDLVEAHVGVAYSVLR